MEYCFSFSKWCFFLKCTTSNKLKNMFPTIDNKLERFCRDLNIAFSHFPTWVWYNKFLKAWPAASRENWACSTAHAWNNNCTAKFEHRNKFSAFWYIIRKVWHWLRQGKMTSKFFHIVFFVVFACCTTVTTVGDHFGGQNDDSNANFSQQNRPSYTYEINK